MTSKARRGDPVMANGRSLALAAGDVRFGGCTISSTSADYDSAGWWRALRGSGPGGQVA